MQTINNGFLELSAVNHGAEIHSIKQLDNDFEFIWNANPSVWNRHAPILFPIVGKLNNNSINIHQKSYQMNQHGFARDSEFVLKHKTNNELCFELKSNSNTLEFYPFQFTLQVIYAFTNIENEVKVTYLVKNENEFEMPFSIGAHPGFNLPVPDLNQYELNFFDIESFEKHLLSEGLFNQKTSLVQLNHSKLPLNQETFNEDAIVIKNTKFKEIALCHKASNYSINCKFHDFTDLGIWAKKGNQDFICIEPWNGFADEIGYVGEIESKKGMVKLPPKEQKEFAYFLSFNS